MAVYVDDFLAPYGRMLIQTPRRGDHVRKGVEERLRLFLT